MENERASEEENMGKRGSRARRRLTPRGFTLQELCICLLIGSTVLAGGMSAWKLVRTSAVTATTNDLIAHLALARSEAIKGRVRVMVCPSRDEHRCRAPSDTYTLWHEGWLVYADGNGDGEPEPAEILRAAPPAPAGLRIRTSRYRRKVTYQPLGTAGGSTITFAVCAENDPGQARYVTISNTGRARASRSTKSSVRCS